MENQKFMKMSKDKEKEILIETVEVDPNLEEKAHIEIKEEKQQK